MICIDEKWLNLPIDGTNCYQFIVDYYTSELDIKLSPYEGELKGREDKKKLAAFLDEYLNISGEWESVDEGIYPDIAMFDINGLMIHGGIVLGAGHMLHMRVHGSMIQKFTDPNLFHESKFKNFKGFYRYKKYASDDE